MALRIDFFSVREGHDLERVDLAAVIAGGPGATTDAAARWDGYVAASDADEAALVELAGLWSTHGVLAGVGVQGVSETPRAVSATDAAALDDFDDATIELLAGETAVDQIRSWSGAAAQCVGVAAASSQLVGWWTRFDPGGSVDDGAEEGLTGSAVHA